MDSEDIATEPVSSSLVETTRSPRFRFSQAQVETMEGHFKSNGGNPSFEQLSALSISLGVTTNQMKNWFTTRKSKERKSLDTPGGGGGAKKKGSDDESDEDDFRPDDDEDDDDFGGEEDGDGEGEEEEEEEEDEYVPKPSKRKAAGEGSGAGRQKKARVPVEDDEDGLADLDSLVGIDWRKVTDVPKLQDEVMRLRKQLRETESELKKVKAVAKTGEKVAQVAVVMNEAKELSAAEKIRKSIGSQLNAQMVYRPGLKHHNSKLTCDVPNMSLTMYKALVKDELFAGFNQKNKQHKVSLEHDKWNEIFGKSLYKSLRYGAHLAPNFPLVMTYSKETQMLHIHGTFTMHR